MPATIVVGAQYGSEGKGKVVALISKSRPVACVVRCGGPNSGHTTSIRGQETVLRQLPASVDVSNGLVALSAGTVVDVDVLEREVRLCGVDRQRLIIDPRAVLVSEEDKRLEQTLVTSIGSTGSGNGRAIARRILRDEVELAAESTRLSKIARVESVAPLLHNFMSDQQEVVVEGTQGFGLSLLHGTSYPNVTSKDTTASAFAMETGLSPRDVNQIVMVVRTLPIRVAGPSGPLRRETSWDCIRVQSGAPTVEPEFTSVTKKLRRVADFDLAMVKLAAAYNKPTSIAVMGVDRLDYRNRGVTSVEDLTEPATDFLDFLRSELGVPIEWIGTGFGTLDAVSTKAAFVGDLADV